MKLAKENSGQTVTDAVTLGSVRVPLMIKVCVLPFCNDGLRVHTYPGLYEQQNRLRRAFVGPCQHDYITPWQICLASKAGPMTRTPTSNIPNRTQSVPCTSWVVRWSCRLGFGMRRVGSKMQSPRHCVLPAFMKLGAARDLRDCGASLQRIEEAVALTFQRLSRGFYPPSASYPSPSPPSSWARIRPDRRTVDVYMDITTSSVKGTKKEVQV